MKDNLNKPFWRYQISFDTENGRMWEEGVINEPIDEKEARIMLFEHAGLRNKPQIVYLTREL